MLVPTTPAREVFHALRLSIQIHATREYDGVHGSPSPAHTGLRPVSLGARREQSRTNVHRASGAIVSACGHRDRWTDVHVRRGRRKTPNLRHRLRRRTGAVRGAIPRLDVLKLA